MHRSLRLSPHFTNALRLSNPDAEQHQESTNQSLTVDTSGTHNESSLWQVSSSRHAVVSGDLTRNIRKGVSRLHTRGAAHQLRLAAVEASGADVKPYSNRASEESRKHPNCICTRCTSTGSEEKDGSAHNPHAASSLVQSFLAVRESGVGTAANNAQNRRGKMISRVEAWARSLPLEFDHKPIEFEKEYRAIAEGRLHVVPLRYISSP